MTMQGAPVYLGYSKQASKLAFFCHFTILLTLGFLSSGCQMGYIIKNGYYQADLLWRRVAIDKVISDPNTNAETKRKLLLAKEAKDFAEKHLGLKQTKNYETYVSLKDRYVTYAVSAAQAYELKPHLWHFPIVGSLPYKGYFTKNEAIKEQEVLKSQGLDTYLRGVSAYSTLGWFNDPLLSSMLAYDDHDLVNVVIHESVHATIYISSQADFNEQLATFLGNKGTELFYLKKEGQNSKVLEKIKSENQDDSVFAQFIKVELAALGDWYRDVVVISPEIKTKRLGELAQRFEVSVMPKLRSENYKKFASLPLNNAVLLTYKTYFNDLNSFELLFRAMGHDFQKLMDFCRTLEKDKVPEETLKNKIKELST
ncbi:MAG: aminopeptidase [Pseudomonadota bacterium]|nr:aminopeptidase [Pseudomonadota bacterium]